MDWVLDEEGGLWELLKDDVHTFKGLGIHMTLFLIGEIRVE